jgi:hypothetical protein
MGAIHSTRYSTVTVTAMMTVETAAVPLPYLRLLAFLAITCTLYVVRKIRKA